MSQVSLSPNLKKAIEDFKLPETLGFGNVMAPVMASCVYENGVWGALELMPITIPVMVKWPSLGCKGPILVIQSSFFTRLFVT
ncbi:MAG: hypothetical protein HOP07_12940 [Bacteriovoracaceae bacterium]|nr:hypothetical protein [Bacteriovoracaceae bacterium]